MTDDSITFEELCTQLTDAASTEDVLLVEQKFSVLDQYSKH